MEDRFFKYAVVISLVLHLGMFVRLYMSPQEEVTLQKGPELSYRLEPVRQEPSPEILAKEASVAPAASAIRNNAGMGLKEEWEGAVSPFRESFDAVSQFRIFERAPEKVKGLKVTKEVSVPVLSSEKINTPAYATYYQIVRDRIRDRAYVNYTRLSVGEVYLTFIIRSNGALAELQILEQKSEANEFLRAVGVKSVQEAAPFPPFPKDLGYPELTFNVQISFQFHEGE